MTMATTKRARRISQLDSVPSAWTEKQLRSFLDSGALPVTGPDKLTYKIPVRFVVPSSNGSAYMVIRAKKRGSGYSLNHSFLEASQAIAKDYGLTLRVSNEEGTDWSCFELSKIWYSGDEIAAMEFQSLSETIDIPSDDPDAECTYTSSALFTRDNRLQVDLQERCRTKSL